MGRNVTARLRRKRDIVVGLAILSLALLIIAKLENEQALRFVGPFFAVDGDTLATAGERLRIEGIDAPELGQTCETMDGSPYACGVEARRMLAALVANGGWECSGTQRDRHDRLLVVCRRGPDDLGEALVAQGYAVAEGRYLVAEAKAREAGEGIWTGHFERPSDWRRLRRVEVAEPLAWVQALVPQWISRWFEE